MSVDLTDCDREPIHVPGAIQPHGVLIAVTEPDLGITHASLNLRELLQVEAGEALGRPLDDVLGEAACRVVRAALKQPQPERAPLTIEKLGHVFDGVVHRHRGGYDPRARESW